ncbi:MAG: metallophosphoesterase [Alphaproteobacteria bacterium]|nr:metallophosphoesterase [Alphaproteobacteria bacterium]
MRIPRFFFAVLIGLSPIAEAAAPVPVHWVQFGPGGAAELRAVANAASCPDVAIDGADYRMAERAAPDENFPQSLCALTLRPGARQVVFQGEEIPLPKPAPTRILVIGDTGCRILGKNVQACNDPEKWPFATIAREAAGLNPDLVIHVGDYDYRESACPEGNAGCAGVVWGDNWASWKADFFDPAEPLLAAAPFVFVRGNHEECSRFGPGWLRLLGPLAVMPGAPCTENIAPYAIPLKDITLAILDDASAPDVNAPSNLVQVYRGDLKAIAGFGPAPVWIATHRPISGYVRVPPGITAGGNQTLLAAIVADGFPKTVELMLAGHIHTFEAINYSGTLPPQLIAGNGGDTLDTAPADLSGLNIGGLPVSSGLSQPGFGFLMLIRSGAGWNVDVYNVHGQRERSCTFSDRKLTC